MNDENKRKRYTHNKVLEFYGLGASNFSWTGSKKGASQRHKRVFYKHHYEIPPVNARHFSLRLADQLYTNP